MKTIDRYQRLVRYDQWANRETQESLAGLHGTSERARRLFAHIVAAESLWIHRMKQEPAHLAVWPELSSSACETELDELAKEWELFFASVTARDLDQRVPYVNSKGERYANTLADILLHVVLHSSYHRGQIASELTVRSLTPPYTDFIHCVRQGWLD